MTYISYDHPEATTFEEMLGLMPTDRDGVETAVQMQERMDRLEAIVGCLATLVLGGSRDLSVDAIKDGSAANLQRLLDVYRTPAELRARELVHFVTPSDFNDGYLPDATMLERADQELESLKHPM